MKWEKFEESKKELPDAVVERTIEGFSLATNDLAQLKLEENSDAERVRLKNLNTRFSFKLILISKHLEDYQYKILDLGYNTKLYPATIRTSIDFAQELKNVIPERTFTVDSPQALEDVMEKFFATELFIDVVSGLMKIARKKRDAPPITSE